MKRACVIGWPVAHSRSPLIHGYWLSKYAIDGGYVRQPVEPGGEAGFLRTMPHQGLLGCNGPRSAKEAAVAPAAVERPTPRAAQVAIILGVAGERLVDA